MITPVHPPSGLSKATWTDADYADMGWHDCRIHAISITDGTPDSAGEVWPPVRLSLDLDYIVGWVNPVRPEKHFTFWVTPATLVFDAWDISTEFDGLNDLLEIDHVHRTGSPDRNPDPQWHIEGHNFDIRLRAGGYRQYLRLPPLHVPRQVLTAAERGGVSLAEESFV
ncbi:hypothetical protein ALI144C_36085 [Actinosynnema sp. ALI-1.44]|uniref:hypothetical protein n=1 Tax=Actinosynnema sp. ALI-1.44 TaxID=1933779 RepID=UPI00097CBE8F|nr:hypothetical protein [Actinosynnema sp. ALI-1.44]ONI76113.1 hypothetical protein ALI144C_36085 [Actinosynnema sp. ALI-1.44]